MRKDEAKSKGSMHNAFHKALSSDQMKGESKYDASHAWATAICGTQFLV